MYKVGDKVLILTDDIVLGNKGEVGIIDEVVGRREEPLYSVVVDKACNSGFWYTENELRLATESELANGYAKHLEELIRG